MKKKKNFSLYFLLYNRRICCFSGGVLRKKKKTISFLPLLNFCFLPSSSETNVGGINVFNFFYSKKS